MRVPESPDLAIRFASLFGPGNARNQQTCALEPVRLSLLSGKAPNETLSDADDARRCFAGLVRSPSATGITKACGQGSGRSVPPTSVVRPLPLPGARTPWPLLVHLPGLPETAREFMNFLQNTNFVHTETARAASET